MQYEQQELTKVIPFSKDIVKRKLTNEKLDKLEVAYKVLKYLIEETDADFSIIIDSEKASSLFEISDKQLEIYKHAILTTNNDQELRINGIKTIFYSIKGDEL